MRPRTLGPGTAALAVMASMVGTGVFTTTGFLIADVGSPEAVLLGWGLGGIAALAGALCYAELGAAYPENGGEYALVGRVWHPFAGFLAGFLSLVVGFGAPIAGSGLAFGKYVRAASPWELPDERLLGAGLILFATLVHLGRVRIGAAVLNGVTGLQMLVVALLMVAGIVMGDPGRLDGAAPIGAALASPAFAVGLVFIGYSYAGWNAAAYIAGELDRPARSLPLGLVTGTLAVTVLYVGINAGILMAAPADALAGKVEVAHIAASTLLGPAAGVALSAVVAFGLVGNELAFLLTGSRVGEALGRDHPRLAFLARRSADGGPGPALIVLAALAMVIGALAAFDTLLTWAGFMLSLWAAVTVLGLPWSRWREPDLPRPFRVPGGPLLAPLVFLVPTGWSIVHTLIERPAAGFAGIATLVVGSVVYAVVRPKPGSGRPGP